MCRTNNFRVKLWTLASVQCHAKCHMKKKKKEKSRKRRRRRRRRRTRRRKRRRRRRNFKISCLKIPLSLLWFWTDGEEDGGCILTHPNLWPQTAAKPLSWISWMVVFTFPNVKFLLFYLHLPLADQARSIGETVLQGNVFEGWCLLGQGSFYIEHFSGQCTYMTSSH